LTEEDPIIGSFLCARSSDKDDDEDDGGDSDDGANGDDGSTGDDGAGDDGSDGGSTMMRATSAWFLQSSAVDS
jgi:hypothetical protein